jgi:hypothetical protein
VIYFISIVNDLLKIGKDFANLFRAFTFVLWNRNLRQLIFPNKQLIVIIFGEYY